MGMHVGHVSAAAAIQGTAVSHWKQGVQGFAALKSALQAGNVDAARLALADLHVPPSSHARSPLALIARAIESGDVALAQQTMQQTLDARMSRCEKVETTAAANAATPATSAGSINLLA